MSEFRCKCGYLLSSFERTLHTCPACGQSARPRKSIVYSMDGIAEQDGDKKQEQKSKKSHAD